MFIITLRNWIMPFKLARLLVTHDGGKLTSASKRSARDRVQPSCKGNPSTQVGLPASGVRVTLPALSTRRVKKEEICEC